MRIPTPEQQSVLERPAPRVRVVRAAPGSGKTWLVAEVIRQEMASWPIATGGIAALSFTRVGGDEIRSAVGYELTLPHFVGTIDAFLFRYVVRPFLRTCYPEFAHPRLIPGEWGAHHWGKFGQGKKATVGHNGISLFGCVFIGENDEGATLAYKPHPAQPLQLLKGEDLKNVKKAKWEMWKQCGYLSHSDAAFWASRIVEHKKHGTRVVTELIQRFPLVIVDELQDTGYFLGRTILRLLSESAARGVLVGDPDQSIFEFNGARPDLFHRFEKIGGAICLPLSTSLRCPSQVTNVANNLKDSGGCIVPAKGRTGRTFLVYGKDVSAEVRRLVDAFKLASSQATIKVVARQNATVDLLIGKNARIIPNLACPALSHMHRAVTAFRQGRQVAALALSRASLDLLTFGHEGVQDADLAVAGIDPDNWKRLSIDCLLQSNLVPATGNLHEFQTLIGQTLDEVVGAFSLSPSLGFTPGKLKPKRRMDWDKPAALYLPDATTPKGMRNDMVVRTVHGVKGETHDVTIFACPDAAKEKDCLSLVWWSPDDKSREEKRIAYVAVTRSRQFLILWVSEKCYQRLVSRQPLFVQHFECMTTNNLVLALTSELATQSASVVS